MIAVQRILPDALGAVLRAAPLSPEKLAFAWRTAVGPSVERATTIALQDRVLHVRTRDAAWQREVERSAHLIHTRLQALLGQDVIETLDVAVGRP